MKSTQIPALADIKVQKIATPERFLTTTRFPVVYQPITKCGCTFVKSVLYEWEYGETPVREQQLNEVPKTEGWTREQITASPFKLVVIRDPVARFFSLYFDKILAVGQEDPHPIHDLFCNKLKIVDPYVGADVDGHRVNCLRAMRWIRGNLNLKTARKPNWHWRPQVTRLKRLRDYDFDVVPLEDLSDRLPGLWGGAVTGDAAKVMARRPANQSRKPVSAQDIEDEELRALILRVYDIDKAIYDQVTAG